MERLLFVRRRMFVIAAVVFSSLLTLVSIPALAQQAPIGMTVSSGLDGLVASDRSVVVRVELSAEVLFVGTVEVSAGTSDFSTPVEIPAGSTKTYELTLPPPSAYDARFVVRLREGGKGEPVALERVRLRTADLGRLVVGVIGSAVPSGLDRTLTSIGDVGVEVVSLADAAGPFDVLDYLILEDGEVTTPLTDWLTAEGRLIVSAGSEQRLGLDLEPLGTFPGTEVAWYRAGSGEVLVVDGSSDVTWSTLLRPVARSYRQMDEGIDFQLMQAASAGEEQRIPSISWLLAAILAYALIAGPIAFFILGRIKRRELAWVVGPIVSVAALSIFWLFGRQQLADSFASHATVVISGQDARMESGIVLAAGSAGTHTVAIPGAESLYASQVQGFGSASARGAIVGDEARFDLAQLGFAGVRARTPVASEGGLTVAVTGDQLTITNDTGVDFVAWGAISGTNGVSGAGGLAAGGSASVERPREARDFGFMNPGEIVGQVLGFDEGTWETWYPLGEFANGLDLGSYVFAFSEDVDLDVEVDGLARRLSGPTMYVAKLDTSAVDFGVSSGQLLATGPGAFVEPMPGAVIVTGASMIVEFDVPPGAVAPSLNAFERMAPRPKKIEYWDWTQDRFVGGDYGPVPAEAINALGLVVVRASANDDFGEPMAPADLQIGWSS